MPAITGNLVGRAPWPGDDHDNESELHKKSAVHGGMSIERIGTNKMKQVSVIGLWHQGVVAAACLADRGYDVAGFDGDADRVQRLNEGKAPVYEPGLDDLLANSLKTGQLRFAAALADAVRGRKDILIMFDTPVNERDEVDLTGFFDTARLLAPLMEADTLIHITAQVPVGSCDRFAELIRATNPSARFGISYSPENLRLGSAIDLFLKPALPVIGADDDETWKRAQDLMSVLNVPFERVNLRTAEMVKHALNSFLATTVTLGNEWGRLCDEVGADAHRLVQVLRMEPRVGPKAMLFPGLAFSGGTLARDVQTLRKLGDESGVETRLLDGLWESNRRHNEFVIHKLEKHFGKLKDVLVTVLGLTYKPGTSTLRRSAALEIIAELVRRGARVRTHDPKADRQELAGCGELGFQEDVYKALEGADAAVIVTGWPDYKNMDFARIKKLMAQPVLVDAGNLLAPDAVAGLGYTYLDIGRGRKEA